MDIIENNLTNLQTPPVPKRFKEIWRKEQELAVANNQNLPSPDYLEITRQRKRKKVTRPKRKSKKIKHKKVKKR